MSDTLSARLAYKVSDDKGFIENLARADDEPASEADNYHLSFLWEPSDNLTVNLSHEKYNADVDSKGSEVSYDEDVATCATPDSIVVTPTCRYSNDCKVNGKSNRTNIDCSPGFTQDEFSDLETSLTSLKMDYQLGEYTGWIRYASSFQNRTANKKPQPCWVEVLLLVEAAETALRL